jgi:L-threonylcarbamoyladenylate synthase
MNNTVKTQILSPEQTGKAAELIRNGEVAALPSETVYGLGANALDISAVEKIFTAKGRPADNPLIVHIPDVSWLERVAENIPPLAYKLAEKFWAGPLTIVLPKTPNIPAITTGGLETVGVRVPDNALFREVLTLANVPIAAPSANTSGKPSPTSALHVLSDLDGKIPAVLDGGECEVGIESTVICFENPEKVRILRPGMVTVQDLKAFCEVCVDNSVLFNDRNSENTAFSSPGMKYKHYAPRAKVILVDGSLTNFAVYCKDNFVQNDYAVILQNETAEFFGIAHYAIKGKGQTDIARHIFGALRELDDKNAGRIFIRLPSIDGVGLALQNRLLRASEFTVIKVSQ